MSADHVSEREGPEAGSKLDARIAEKVMGWKRGTRYGNGNGEWVIPGEPDSRLTWDRTPRFSTDIAAAFLVVEKMRESGWRYCLVGYVSTPLQECVFERGLGRDGDRFIAGAEALPLAICRAALAVAGSPTEEDTR